MDSDTAVITAVVQHYFPDWTPPENQREWNLCHCPAHEDKQPSCTVNFGVGAIHCKGCGFKGDVIAIIRRQEGVSYGNALERAEVLSGGRYEAVQPKPQRKRGRRAFGASGPGERSRDVPAWLRS